MVKTPLAVQKSDYSHTLHQAINRKLSPGERYGKLLKLEKIEKEVKEMGDEIEIVITTKKTSPFKSIPAMSTDDIDKNREIAPESKEYPNINNAEQLNSIAEDDLDIHGTEDDDHGCAGVLCDQSNHKKED